jgi:hypothetical protein
MKNHAIMGPKRFEVPLHVIIGRRKPGKSERGRDWRPPPSAKVEPSADAWKVSFTVAPPFHNQTSQLTSTFSDAENEDEAPAATQETEMKTEPKAIEPPPTPITTTAPDSPQPSIKEPPKSHKKGGRPPHPRKGKQGKNQYTRDRDDPENGLDSPARSQSRDIGGDDHNEKGPGPGHRSTNSGSKLGRPRGSGSKVSMLDMRRRVAGMLDFISKTQVEMAGEATPSGANGTPNGVHGHGHGLGGASPSSANSAGEATKEAMRGLAEALLPGLNGDGGAEGVESVRREFKDLSLLEMMDRLTAELVKWQKAYA